MNDEINKKRNIRWVSKQNDIDQQVWGCKQHSIWKNCKTAALWLTSRQMRLETESKRVHPNSVPFHCEVSRWPLGRNTRGNLKTSRIDGIQNGSQWWNDWELLARYQSFSRTTAEAPFHFLNHIYIYRKAIFPPKRSSWNQPHHSRGHLLYCFFLKWDRCSLY